MCVVVDEFVSAFCDLHTLTKNKKTKKLVAKKTKQRKRMKSVDRNSVAVRVYHSIRVWCAAHAHFGARIFYTKHTMCNVRLTLFSFNIIISDTFDLFPLLSSSATSSSACFSSCFWNYVLWLMVIFFVGNITSQSGTVATPHDLWKLKIYGTIEKPKTT